MKYTEHINVFILFLTYANTTQVSRYPRLYRPYNLQRNEVSKPTLNTKNTDFNLKELINISQLLYKNTSSINFNICKDDKNNSYIVIRDNAKLANNLQLSKNSKKNFLSLNINNIDAGNFKIPTKNKGFYQETFKKDNYQTLMHNNKELYVYSRMGNYFNSIKDNENVFYLIPITKNLENEISSFNIKNSGEINNINGYNHCYIIATMDNILSQILLTINHKEICESKIEKLLTITSSIGNIMNDDEQFKKFCEAIIYEQSMSPSKWMDKASIKSLSKVIYQEIKNNDYHNLFDSVRSVGLFLLAIKSNTLNKYTELNNTCIYKIFDTISENQIIEKNLYENLEGKLENVLSLYDPKYLYTTTTPKNGHYEAKISGINGCEKELKNKILDFYQTFNPREYNEYNSTMNFFSNVYPEEFIITSDIIKEYNKK